MGKTKGFWGKEDINAAKRQKNSKNLEPDNSQNQKEEKLIETHEQDESQNQKMIMNIIWFWRWR